MFSLGYPKITWYTFYVLRTNSLSTVTVNRLEPENKLYRQLKMTYVK